MSDKHMENLGFWGHPQRDWLQTHLVIIKALKKRRGVSPSGIDFYVLLKHSIKRTIQVLWKLFLWNIYILIIKHIKDSNFCFWINIILTFNWNMKNAILPVLPYMSTILQFCLTGKYRGNVFESNLEYITHVLFPNEHRNYNSFMYNYVHTW